jgi:hypothetical protein
LGLIQNRKSQQGVFIGVFALATLVVISLAINFMSNRVNELLVGQSQMISGKQAYWSAYSGMELLSGSQLADASNTGTKIYSFSGGTISIIGESSAALYNGEARTNEHTVTGTDGNSSRQIKWVLESQVSGSALFLKNSNTNQNTDWVNINSIQLAMEMNAACDQTVEGHNNETDCDARADGHTPSSIGHFKPTRYADGNEVADYTVSFWVRPDFETMQATIVSLSLTEIGSHEECIVFGVGAADGDHVENGTQIGIDTEASDDGVGYLNFHFTDDGNSTTHNINVNDAGGVEWDNTDGTPTQMTSNNWYHVVYYRTVSDGYGYAYVNGVYQGKHLDYGYYTATDRWSLGTDLDPGSPDPTNNFAGLLDEVAVWKIALSKAQIQSLYIQGRTFNVAANIQGSDLVAYWSFNDESDPTDDVSSNSNTGDITGATFTGS